MFRAALRFTATTAATSAATTTTTMFSTSYSTAIRNPTSLFLPSPRLFRPLLSPNTISFSSPINRVSLPLTESKFAIPLLKWTEHLCEFAGLDVEMEIKKHYYEIMDKVDRLFVSIFDSLNQNCKKALEAVQWHTSTHLNL